jgi:hypothetical protein
MDFKAEMKLEISLLPVDFSLNFSSTEAQHIPT